MKNILITGGAGFIGSHIVRLLNEKHPKSQINIVVVDTLYHRAHKSVKIRDLSSLDADFRVFDINSLLLVRDVIEETKPDVIVHLAAETSTGDSAIHPSLQTHGNVTGTASLIEAIILAAHRPAHFILSSSRAVYGEGGWVDPATDCIFYPKPRQRSDLERGVFDIGAPSGLPAKPTAHCAGKITPKPVSVYGQTKLWQEDLLTLWCEAANVPLTILRMQNVYGIGQPIENSYAGIIAQFHKMALLDAPITVYEDGNILRDFIYVTDVAKVFYECITEPVPQNKIIDVGSGMPMSLLSAATNISKEYNRQAPIVNGRFRVGDVRAAWADVKALRNLGIHGQHVSFDEGTKAIRSWLGVSD